MKKNSELPKIRITTELFNKIQKCITSIEEQTQIQISLSSFRRMAYQDFVDRVLRDGLELHFKPS